MGGVTAFEFNTLTGGAGARYVGIGGNTDYRLDSVTIDLRVVSVRNGRVYSTVAASKSIYSVLLQAGVFKIFGTNNLLEAEVGYTRNEPSQLAVRQAIEKAIYGMVMKGSLTGLWQFADAGRGKQVQSQPSRGAPATPSSPAPWRRTRSQPAGPAAPAVRGPDGSFALIASRSGTETARLSARAVAAPKRRSGSSAAGHEASLTAILTRNQAASVEQSGQRNAAQVIQTGGGANLTQLDQWGAAEVATIASRGAGNVIGVTQECQAQEASVRVDSDANRLDVDQAGRRNAADLQSGAAGNDWIVEQVGRGLAIRILRDGDSQPLAVRQTGP